MNWFLKPSHLKTLSDVRTGGASSQTDNQKKHTHFIMFGQMCRGEKGGVVCTFLLTFIFSFSTQRPSYFACTTKCNTMNTYEERLCENVRHFPTVEDLCNVINDIFVMDLWKLLGILDWVCITILIKMVNKLMVLHEFHWVSGWVTEWVSRCCQMYECLGCTVELQVVSGNCFKRVEKVNPVLWNVYNQSAVETHDTEFSQPPSQTQCQQRF